MKSLKNLFCLFFLVGMLASCHTREKVVYMQGATWSDAVEPSADYSPRIKKDDQLFIIVNSSNPEVAAPYNMQLTQRAFTGGTGSFSLGSGGGGSPQIFWVDPNGEIDYPGMGKLKVEGMTRLELANMIKDYFTSTGLISDAVVNVMFNNYKISVLGEVNRPGQFTITTDRVSVFDAIAMAGDLTIFGERDKVHVYREQDGKQIACNLDLRDPKVMTSPCYYLQQNDIVYVEPNATKASNREVSSLYTFGISLASLALTIATFIRSFK